MTLAEEARRAASLLTDHAMARVVVRGADADAVAAGVLLAHALDREGVHFHLSFLDDLTEGAAEGLRGERNDVLVLVGLGPGGLGAPAAGLAENVIVIDRDAAPNPGDGPVFTPQRARLQAGVEASAATMAHVIAEHLSRRNEDLAVLALAGAIADGQHAGGWRGLNAEVLEGAVDAGAVERQPAFPLRGATVLEALAQTTAPYVPGIAGRARAAKRFLESLGIDTDQAPNRLEPAERTRLASALTLRILEADAPEGALDLLLPERVSPVAGSLSMEEAGALAARFSACAAEGAPTAGAASVWGERAAAERADEAVAAHGERLLAALMRVEKERGGRDGLPFHRVDAPDARIAPRLVRLAGLSLLTPDRPVIALAEAGSGTVAEGWAHRSVLRAGVDLGDAFRVAAEAAGGNATGSKASARARFQDADAFLKALARELSEAEDASDASEGGA